MTLVDDYQIEKFGLELSKRFVTLLTRQLMIKAHENLIGAVELFIFYLAHDFFERLKILCHGLVNQNISVGKVKNSADDMSPQKFPYDLKGSKSLSRAGRHDEQEAFISFSHGFNHAVDCDALIVARRLVLERVIMIGRKDNLFLRGRKFFAGAITLPELFFSRK